MTTPKDVRVLRWVRAGAAVGFLVVAVAVQFLSGKGILQYAWMEGIVWVILIGLVFLFIVTNSSVADWRKSQKAKKAVKDESLPEAGKAPEDEPEDESEDEPEDAPEEAPSDQEEEPVK